MHLKRKKVFGFTKQPANYPFGTNKDSIDLIM
jgi:hypothetical protein